MLLNLECSPEQIVGFLKRHNYKIVSHESIYQYIWETKRMVAAYGNSYGML